MHGPTPEADELGALVRRVILSHWPERFSETELGDGVPLGEDGLGFDSIELAEIIISCEDETGRLVGEELFSRGSITIRELIGHFAGL